MHVKQQSDTGCLHMFATILQPHDFMSNDVTSTAAVSTGTCHLSSGCVLTIDLLVVVHRLFQVKHNHGH